MLELALGRLAAVRRDVPFQICHRFGDVCIGTRNALFFSIRFFATRRGICRRVLSAISLLSSNASSSRSITLRPRPRPRQIERTSCLICDNQPMAMFRKIIRDIRRTLQLQEPRHQTAPSHQSNQVCAVDDLAISTNDKALEPHCAMNNHLTCTWKTTQNYASFSQRRPSSS